MAQEPKRVKNSQRKRRYFGRGTWYCMECGASWKSEFARALNIDPRLGCPDCGGRFEYMED